MSRLDTFLATRRWPRFQGSARKALSVPCGYEGRFLALHELVELKVDAGWRVESVELVDEAAHKRLTAEVAWRRRDAPIGNPKHPETIALRNAEKALASGPMRTERRLAAADGTFLRGLGKTAMDYAEHLIQAAST